MSKKMIFLKYTNTIKTNTFNVIYHYKNGYLIKENLQSGIYDYKVIVDKKENKIDFYQINKADAEHFKTYNRYYDEINSNDIIEFGFYKASASAVPKASMYIKGERMPDINCLHG